MSQPLLPAPTMSTRLPAKIEALLYSLEWMSSPVKVPGKLGTLGSARVPLARTTPSNRSPSTDQPSASRTTEATGVSKRNFSRKPKVSAYCRKYCRSSR